MTARTLGRHAGWWERIDATTRRYLLAADYRAELPRDVWRDCLAAAQAEDLILDDGWPAELSTRRLPFVAASYVEVLRHDPMVSITGCVEGHPVRLVQEA